MRCASLALTLGAALLAGCGDTTNMPNDASARDASADTATDAATDAGSDASADKADVADDTASSGCDDMRRMFWTWNLRVMPPPNVQLEAGCRVARPHLYVFSTDDVWGMQLTATRAEAIAHAFEESAPADPTRGIYAIETAVYGSGPDLDNDPHVVLLYQNMGSFHGYTFDGFFRSLDESTTDEHSNQMEMLHVDAVRMDPTNEYMLGVVAHEFVHLLAYSYGDEDVWLSETLAETGMAMTGYLGDLRLARTFATRATSSLVGNTAGMDYGPFFLFGTYLYERFGAMAIGDIARSRARGVASVQTALASRGGGTFAQVFGDWAVANLVDAARPPYGYATFDISTEAAAATLTRATAATATATPWAASYALIDLDASDTAADVTLESTSFASLVVHAVAYDRSARADATVSTFALTGASTMQSVTLPAGKRRLAIVVANPSATAAPYQLTVNAH